MTQVIVWLCVLLCCGPLFSQRNYKDSMDAWDKNRFLELKAPNGWVNLAGLFWLSPGKNSFGSNDVNQVVYRAPGFPTELGTWHWTGDSIYWISKPGFKVTAGNNTSDTILAWISGSPVPQLFSYSHYRWTIIQRESKTGVRFRDLESPALDSFRGIRRFPVDPSWKVKATVVSKPGSMVAITNVFGQTSVQASPGALHFKIRGVDYSLDALDEGDDRLFMIFGDDTNGDQTYPSGRYLYIPKPGPSGETVIDFNKAENPPCAFTPFATCPLPPKQNRLPLAVTAGEREVIGLKH